MLLDEFLKHSPALKGQIGGLYAMVASKDFPENAAARINWMENKVANLSKKNKMESIGAALSLMQIAYERKAVMV